MIKGFYVKLGLCNAFLAKLWCCKLDKDTHLTLSFLKWIPEQLFIWLMQIFLMLLSWGTLSVIFRLACGPQIGMLRWFILIGKPIEQRISWLIWVIGPFLLFLLLILSLLPCVWFCRMMLVELFLSAL